MNSYPSLGDDFFDRIQKDLKSVKFETISDPTRSWTLDAGSELALDLDSSALSGVATGDPFDKLSFLGPAERFTPTVYNCVDLGGKKLDAPSPKYQISYLSRGVGFLTDLELRIESFHIYFQPDPREAGCGVFAGKVVWKGADIGVASIDNADAVVAVLGVPDRDEEEPEHDHPISGLGKEPYRRWMWYERPGAIWMWDFDESGRTQGFGIFQSPAKAS